MAASPRAAWLATGGGVLFVLAACNEVLGIEPAQVDPRLEAAGKSSTGAAAGAGGSAQGGSGARGGADSDSGRAGALATGGSSGDKQEASAGAAGSNASAGEGGEAGSPHTGNKGGSGGTHSGHGGSGHMQAGAPGDAGSDGGGPVSQCDQYCDLMQASCTGEAAQYRDRDQCMRICGMLPAGQEGDADDTVACRLKYADKMRYANGAEVTDYCHKAGPSGDGKCGTVCGAYCALMMTVCTEDSAGEYHFANADDCLTTCAALPQAAVAYSSSDPLVSDGNHAMCRLFHVTSAAMADADEHCEHAMGHTLCQAPAQ